MRGSETQTGARALARMLARALLVTAALASCFLSGAARAQGAAVTPAEGARQAYHAGQVAADHDQGRRDYQRGIALAREALARDPNEPGGLCCGWRRILPARR